MTDFNRILLTNDIYYLILWSKDTNKSCHVELRFSAYVCNGGSDVANNNPSSESPKKGATLPY